ncbi:NUP170 [Symbiodinium natans]|uniref:NUP170 protein n=1 Tax=Symbiodinium natans TaxID=878477 RepID=A0A812JN45_9DINO|nr:NUP170 [Symbiodinium natans]
MSGVVLFLRILVHHFRLVDLRWDPRLVELTTALKMRIPEVVEERCRRAQQRANCGLLAQTHHAWASADDLLHIWDYHRENPEVLMVPADSAIVSVAAVPPRPGIFDRSVNWLLVICTRLTVSLVGLHHTPSASRLYRESRETSSSSRRAKEGPPGMTGAGGYLPPGGGSSTAPAHAESLRLVALEGYSARL